jgi:DNA mismatch endonuclease (patch repair protein)
VAIFVDGCFWHGCKKCYREPRSNKDYWRMKVKRNRDRDARVNAACKKAGWSALRLWEHVVMRSPKDAVSKIKKALARNGRKAAQKFRKPERSRGDRNLTRLARNRM